MDSYRDEHLLVEPPTQFSSGALVDRFLQIRQQSEALVEPLSEADAQLQSMPDVSPAKWHLAHTTWFFETFILCLYIPEYCRVNETFNYLFNSYYNRIGEQYPRHQRGLISRPSLSEVMGYRHAVDDHLCHLLAHENRPQVVFELYGLIELGLQHEQQHQELLLTDIKHALFQNPLYPVYRSKSSLPKTPNQHNTPIEWLSIKGGLVSIGHDNQGFSYDNERPVHTVYVHDFSLASRLVSNGEYLQFINSGGYTNPDYWLSDGWAWLQSQHNKDLSPLYWVNKEGHWYEYTLYGLLPLDESQAVIHISYYEANAYANWLGARLPTECEWEHAARQHNRLPDQSQIQCHPMNIVEEGVFSQCFSTAWQWTSSSYSPYPGFTPFSGVAGEYNGKFMSNQYVLRGSSCVTPVAHTRQTYRNFFYPHQNWQFTSIRLAK